GNKHTSQIVRGLRGKAVSVRVVRLPDLPPKGDVSDWLESGGTREKLELLISATPESPPLNDEKQTDESDNPDETTDSQAQALIRQAEGAFLFHDDERRGYATVQVNDHKETVPIRSNGFKHWLVRRVYQSRKKPPSTTALNDALGLIEAQAIFDGPELPINVRVAELNGNICLDLCNPLWEAVEIGPAGWTILSSDEVPVKFRRAR